jgi:hypothetical protein
VYLLDSPGCWAFEEVATTARAVMAVRTVRTAVADNRRLFKFKY